MTTRVLVAASCCLLAAGCYTITKAGPDGQGVGEAGRRDGIVIGHRGLGRGHAPEPENDVEALVKALEQGAAAVEFDVQLTADGEVVLAHDEVLDRITDGTGCLSDRTAAELGQLRLRDGNGTLHPGRRIATLAEALAALRPYATARRGLVADVHIKVFDGVRGDVSSPNFCRPTDWSRLTGEVIAGLRAAGLVRSALVTSFDARALERARELDPSVRVGLISLLSTRLALVRARAAGFDAIVVPDHDAGRSDLEQARAAGIETYVWFPAGEPEEADAFALDHADGVITDHPQLASALRGGA